MGNPMQKPPTPPSLPLQAHGYVGTQYATGATGYAQSVPVPATNATGPSPYRNNGRLTGSIPASCAATDIDSYAAHQIIGP